MLVMEGIHVSTIVRLRLFFALGLVAALLVAAGPHQAFAATLHVKTGSYLSPDKCSHEEGGENICSIQSGGSVPYKFLTVMGYHFTPHGEVEVYVVVAGTNNILVDYTLHAKANGAWGIRTQIEVCTGGKHLIAMAIDKHTGVLSNLANAFACSV
jgi:hypothetical protein